MRDANAFIIRVILVLLFALIGQFLPTLFFMLYEHMVAFKNMDVEKVFFRLQIFFFPPLTIPCVCYFFSKYLSKRLLIAGIFTSLLLSLCHSYAIYTIANNPREYLYLFTSTPTIYLGEIAEAEVYMRIILYSVFANLTFIFYTCSYVFLEKLRANFFKAGICLSLLVALASIPALHYANTQFLFFYGILALILGIVALVTYSYLALLMNKKAMK